MNIKDFFLSIAQHKIPVEIYYKEDYLNDISGFRINNIDSEAIDSSEFDLITEINGEILDAFASLDCSIVGKMEGDTTWKIFSNLTCIKKAEYFSKSCEAWEFWIDKKETQYYFEKKIEAEVIELYKENNMLKVWQTENVRKLLSEKEYKDFYNFYDKLLEDFIDLDVISIEINENENVSYGKIIYLQGVYEEPDDIKWLDGIGEYPVSILKTMLIKCFKLSPYIAEIILNKP